MDTPLWLLVDAPVREKRHCFVTSELEQNVRVGHEEHLTDLMELLLADDADFAAAWGRLHDKTELFVVLLALGNQVGCH